MAFVRQGCKLAADTDSATLVALIQTALCLCYGVMTRSTREHAPATSHACFCTRRAWDFHSEAPALAAVQLVSLQVRLTKSHLGFPAW